MQLIDNESPKFKVENANTFNWMNAIRGMRNPKKSYNKIDSYYEIAKLPDHTLKEGDKITEDTIKTHFVMGENDYDLAMRLATAGSDHGKFLRQIEISMDITAGWMFWKQYATYKVATVENSTSMMNTLGDEKLKPKHFCWDRLTAYREGMLKHLNHVIKQIEHFKEEIKDQQPADTWKERKKVKELKDLKKKAWRELNEDMPGSFLYKRTCTLNYEVARNMYHARKGHKLVEWTLFRSCLDKLPYSELITEPR